MDFHGSICAIVTPFDGAGALDLDGFARLLDLHRARGTQGIVVAGSTGESASIDEGEFRRLLAFALQRVGDRLRVIAGCGAPATHKALHLVRSAAAEGAHGALVVTPYYVRPTQEGLYRHYAQLGDQGGLPVLLYNVPGRTGCDLLPETVARLAGRTGIAGVKEARPERDRLDALLALRRPGFAILSGDDPTCVAALLAGADGVISVAANVVPGAFRALVDLARAGRAAEAQALDAQLGALYGALAFESNPIPAKWLLHRLGLIGPGLRLPLLELSAHFHAAADDAVALVRTLEAHHPAPSHGSRAA